MNFFDVLFAKKLSGSSGSGGDSLHNPMISIKFVNNSGADTYVGYLTYLDGFITDSTDELTKNSTHDVVSYGIYENMNNYYYSQILYYDSSANTANDKVNCEYNDNRVFVLDHTKPASLTITLSTPAI